MSGIVKDYFKYSILVYVDLAVFEHLIKLVTQQFVMTLFILQTIACDFFWRESLDFDFALHNISQTTTTLPITS